MAVPRTTTLIAAAVIALTLADIGVAIGRSTSSGSSPSATSTPPAIPASPLAPGSPPPAIPASPGGAGPATPTTPPEPNSLAGQLAKTFQLALAQHTVHSVAKNVSKKGTATFDDYDGVQTGEQHIAINGGHVDVRVIGPTTYFTGDAKGLAIYGFTPQAVQALHGQWLSLVAGQPGYRIITAGVTISSTLQADAITGPLTRRPAKTLDGVKVYGIAGTGSGPGSPQGSHATMWISEQTGLPVAFDATNRTTTITETFSDWGKPIHVTTPADVYGQPGLAS
ncbi:MAG TPA: hypothetical protein VHB69_08445 [Mycobacteriales bacterium]|nr:hypothetical protein [Mycobacteriales bacterium]